MNNAIKYVKTLESTGIPRDQAEAQVQLVMEMIDHNLATKRDLENLEERLDSKFLQLEYRMTIQLGTIVTVALAAFVAISKLL